MSRTHSIWSQDGDGPIEFFEQFDRERLRERIIAHLGKYPNDTVEHCREYSKEDTKQFLGVEIINFYEINPRNGKPSLAYERNSKQYYKAL